MATGNMYRQTDTQADRVRERQRSHGRTCTENLYMWLILRWGRTDRQTDTLIAILRTLRGKKYMFTDVVCMSMCMFYRDRGHCGNFSVSKLFYWSACFARWCLLASAVVVCNAAGGLAAGRVGGRAATLHGGPVRLRSVRTCCLCWLWDWCDRCAAVSDTRRATVKPSTTNDAWCVLSAMSQPML